MLDASVFVDDRLFDRVMRLRVVECGNCSLYRLLENLVLMESYSR